LATDRQTDKQTDEQMDSTDALSRSRCRDARQSLPALRPITDRPNRTEHCYL